MHSMHAAGSPWRPFPLAAPRRQTLTSAPPRPTPPCPHSWSVAVVPNSVDQTTATIAITPPAFGTFDIFVLSVCVKPSSGTPNWDACPKTNCLPTQVRRRRAGCWMLPGCLSGAAQAGAATAPMQAYAAPIALAACTPGRQA